MKKKSVNPFRLVILISGFGSNLQAIIDAIKNQKLPVTISAVISNRSDAYGLQRAAQAKIPTHIFLKTDYSNAAEYDSALQNCIDQYQPDLVVLAGFMRILTPKLVNHFAGRIVNIHPSLLPKYQGLNTHARVLAGKETEHGVTVHFVTEELDGGPIIMQKNIAIYSDDTVETLQEKIHQLEHELYPLVIKMIAEKKVKWVNGKVVISN